MDTVNELRAEMYQQLDRIDRMDAEECLDFMSGLYDHDLDACTPLDDLRAEAKAQCRRAYESVLTDSERADWFFIEALIANARRH